jgi:hypothetical protein
MRRHAKYDWVIKLSVDGRLVASRIIARTKYCTRTLRFAHDVRRGRKEIRRPPQACSPGQFTLNGSLGRRLIGQQTTDKDNEVTLAGAALQPLGKIRVEFFRGTEGSETTPAPRLIAPDVGIAAEKSKK